MDLQSDVRIVFDEAIVLCENVNLSSGHPAMGLEMKESDLIALCKPIIAPIAEEVI